jgi:hypothetical protein
MKKNIFSELESSINRFDLRSKKLTLKSKKLASTRLIVFFTSLILFFYFYITGLESGYWSILGTFVFSFGILTGFQNKIDGAILKNNLWIKIKELNLARLNIDWKNIPNNNKDNYDEQHPFQKDLDIIGNNSLIHLIDNTTSEQGHNLLVKWLTTYKNDYEEIISRQRMVRELISENRFRNKLQLQFLLASKRKLNGEILIEKLGEENSIHKIKNILISLFIIIPINLVLIILYFTNVIPAYFALSSLLYLAFHWFNIKYISSLFEKADSLLNELGKFSVVLEFIESNPLTKSPYTKKLCSTIFDKVKSPAKEFERLNRLLYALSFQKNPLFEILLNIAFPWDFYFAYKFEKVKNEIKELLPEWLDVWYNLEALNSLANFGWLNPDYSFPFIVKDKSNEENIFSVKNTGHPLIPSDQKIVNNFSISSLGEVSIITGSNMSGKSTFLKTLGINLSLAFAGAPVNASEMTTPVFRIFSSLKVNDSVTGGVSFFYAEVKRLKFLLDELDKKDELPLFFFIDEIFRGTNNVERLIGSRSYVKTISGKNGIGLISTHDLELIKLENEISSVKNFHFREEAVENKMIFDYKLRTGPCPTTNALKIMKIEGLPVELK